MSIAEFAARRRAVARRGRLLEHLLALLQIDAELVEVVVERVARGDHPERAAMLRDGEVAEARRDA